jgi:hypothetical protein
MVPDLCRRPHSFWTLSGLAIYARFVLPGAAMARCPASQLLVTTQ